MTAMPPSRLTTASDEHSSWGPPLGVAALAARATELAAQVQLFWSCDADLPCLTAASRSPATPALEWHGRDATTELGCNLRVTHEADLTTGARDSHGAATCTIPDTSRIGTSATCTMDRPAAARRPSIVGVIDESSRGRWVHCTLPHAAADPSAPGLTRGDDGHRGHLSSRWPRARSHSQGMRQADAHHPPPPGAGDDHRPVQHHRGDVAATRLFCASRVPAAAAPETTMAPTGIDRQRDPPPPASSSSSPSRLPPIPPSDIITPSINHVDRSSPNSPSVWWPRRPPYQHDHRRCDEERPAEEVATTSPYCSALVPPRRARMMGGGVIPLRNHCEGDDDPRLWAGEGDAEVAPHTLEAQLNASALARPSAILRPETPPLRSPAAAEPQRMTTTTTTDRGCSPVGKWSVAASDAPSSPEPLFGKVAREGTTTVRSASTSPLPYAAAPSESPAAASSVAPIVAATADSGGAGNADAKGHSVTISHGPTARHVEVVTKPRRRHRPRHCEHRRFRLSLPPSFTAPFRKASAKSAASGAKAGIASGDVIAAGHAVHAPPRDGTTTPVAVRLTTTNVTTSGGAAMHRAADPATAADPHLVWSPSPRLAEHQVPQARFTDVHTHVFLVPDDVAEIRRLQRLCREALLGVQAS